MTRTPVRRGLHWGVALGAAMATVAQPLTASAHEVGDHGNLHVGGNSCLEARNHFEESHRRNSGFGTHLYAKSESTLGITVLGAEICPGIPLGLPRGHLYARYQLLIHDRGLWWQCLNVAGLSTSSGQWSKTVAVDTGNKAPCVPLSNRGGYWFANRTSHYYVKNGSWRGSWLQSAPHILHNP